MDIRSALKEQYHAGLKMLRQAVEICPEHLWLGGAHPRTFWRIAFHAAFYTNLYLAQNEHAFERWPKHRDCARLWENPPEETPYTREEMIEFIEHVDALIDGTVDSLDLDSQVTGFDWYPNMTKLSHQIMNIRHLQGHIGQLSELLMADNPEIEVEWVAKAIASAPAPA
jgi:hypothetical protein